MKKSIFPRVLAVAALALCAAAAAHADAWGLGAVFAALGAHPADVLLGLAGAGMMGKVVRFDEHDAFDEADMPAVTAIALAAAAAGQPLRQDASPFFGRLLDFVRSRIYETQAPAMRAFDMIPITSEVPAWAETVTTRSYSAYGMAKIIANYADDLPRADVGGTESTIRVKDIGDSYGYNVTELRAAEATNTPLIPRKAQAARRAIDVKTAQLAMLGEAQYGLFGLLNHPNIGTTTGLTGDWTNVATTNAQVLADINKLAMAIPLQSNGIHRTTMIALAMEDYAQLTTRFVADSGGQTIMQVFRANFPDVELMPVVELLNAGPGGTTNGVIVAERSPENYAFEIPMMFNQLPAQARNLELVVNCLQRVAGLLVFYPLALTKAYI